MSMVYFGVPPMASNSSPFAVAIVDPMSCFGLSSPLTESFVTGFNCLFTCIQIELVKGRSSVNTHTLHLHVATFFIE